MSIRFAKPVPSSLLIAAVFLAACGQTTSPPAPQGVAVRVEPPAVTVVPGGSTRFSASVTGTALTSVAWSVQEVPSCGTVTPDGAYLAPAAPATCHVLATSAADPAVAAIALVTVSPAPGVPGALTLSPATATIDACGRQAFTVTGAAAADVAWSVEETGGGTVTDGAYVAPSTPGTYHVVASLRPDPSRTARATATVGPERIVAVAVTPPSPVLVPGGTQAFGATVTTTCGSFAAQ
ncbi:MAG: hypothetical protein WB493_08280 [Anaeromyxobacteraceae bacterium]